MTQRDVRALAKELKGWMAKATQGKWLAYPHGRMTCIYTKNNQGRDVFIAKDMGDIDAALVIAAINALPAILDALEQPITAEEVRAIIARRLAKRQHGEHYEGYESSHRETAEDIAAALNRAKHGEQS